MKINITNFIENFVTVYNVLYSNEELIDYNKAIEKFNNKNFIKKYNDILTEFIKARGYCILSDRDAAAFILTLNIFMED